MDASAIGSGRLIAIGLAQITGTVTRLGVPGVYRVRLYERHSGQILLECWSAADGAYAFTGLQPVPSGYYVVALDHAGTPVNAAISDYLTPEIPA
jgi:hypothetical protein